MPFDASDKELCERLHQGDETAFRQLFDTYYGQLYRFFCYRGIDPAMAEDMAQDVFVKVWQGRSRLDANKSIKAYLFTAAANEIRMFLRKKRVRDAYAKEEKASGVSYSLPFTEFETKAAIETAIQALPEHLRTVFVLHRYDHLTYREIAEMQQVSVKTVESRMSKALKRLKIALQHFRTLLVIFFC